MKMLVVNREIILSILMVVVFVCGVQDISYGLDDPHGIALDVAGGKMYWTDDSADKIQRANLDGSNIETLIALGYGDPYGIALDVAGGKMYWADEGRNKILRANLDGSNIETLVAHGLDDPHDIALDVAGGKMYWTDDSADRIQRANLDGSNIETLVRRTKRSFWGGISGRGDPYGIALDVAGGKMYWADEGENEILRANLDGSNIEILVSHGLANPHGIALDVIGGKMYWTDDSANRIQRANLDGSNIENLITHGLIDPYGIALDIAGGKMYWADEGANKIQRANLDGSNIEDLVPLRISSQVASTTNTTLSISPSPVASPAVGEQLTLSLNIEGGKNAAGYEATVQFDTTALRYVSSTNGDYLPDGAFFVPPVVDGNRVKLAATSLTGERSGDGTLATLTFEAIAVKASTLTLSAALLANSAGVSSRPQVEAGQITATPQRTGDVNGDGTINIQDLVLVASNLGQSGQNTADVNGDGTVNIQDLVLVAGALGTSAAAPSLYPHSVEMPTATAVHEWLTQAQQLDLMDTTSRRGIHFLEKLLTALIPKETVLLANYPNPFNPETWIPYQLETSAEVTLTIYAVDGQSVRQLALGHQAAGAYQSRSRAAYWDGRNAVGEPVASGLYFYTLTARDFSATRKMLIRK